MTSPLNRSETRSISIPAPPAAVVEFVGDGANLPRWAPAFAPAVRRDGSVWTIESGDRRARIRLRVAPETGGAAVCEQMATVERELETVRSLCSTRREG